MELQPIFGNTELLLGRDANVPLCHLGEHRVVLLDGGCPGGEDREILALLDGQGWQVTAVLCTHAHPDHMGLCRTLQQRGAVVAMPRFEAQCVESLAHLKAWYPLFTYEQLRQYFEEILFSADLLIAPGQARLELGGAEFQLLSAPGHTPDQVAVKTPDGVWYAADGLMSRRDCQRAKLPYAFSVRDYLKTAETLAGLPGPLLLGHGAPEQDPAALAAENRQAMLACAQRVLDLVQGEMTAEELLQAAVTHWSIKSGADTYGLRVLDRNLTAFRDYLMDRGDLEQRARMGRMVYCRAQARPERSQEHGS